MRTKQKDTPFCLRNVYFSALTFATLTFFATWLLLNGTQRKGYALLAFYGLFLLFYFKASAGIRNLILDYRLEFCLSLFFSAATVLGVFFDRDISFGNMDIWHMLEWFFCTAILMIPIRRLLRLLCKALTGWIRREGTYYESPRNDLYIQKKTLLSGKPAVCFLICFVVILACWLPVWLAYYPGLWNYDPWQAEQVISGIYSKHHPLVHTLLLGNCYRFALERNDVNLAPIFYSAIQGGICAAIFALACTFIRQNTKSVGFFVVSLLFFALFPVNPILAMSTTKDTLFAAMSLFAELLFLFMGENKPKQKKLLIATEIPVLVLVILLRNNAIYCFLLLIMLCFLMLKKGLWRKILAVLMAATILGSAADRGLGYLLQASPALTAEMCSVPSQMAGRVQNQVKELDSETSAFLDKFYSIEELSYSPALADGTKCCLRLESRADLIQYIEGSVRLFLRYPAVCIDSFLYTTEGLWNLLDVSHARIYGTRNRQGYLATNIQTGYQIEPSSKLPLLESFLERQFTENAFLNIPILHFLFAPAFYVYLLLLIFCVMLRGKNRKRLIIPLFMIFLVFTIALGPGILPRYIYPLMVSMPVLIWTVMKSVIISPSSADSTSERLKRDIDFEKTF